MLKLDRGRFIFVKQKPEDSAVIKIEKEDDKPLFSKVLKEPPIETLQVADIPFYITPLEEEKD